MNTTHDQHQAHDAYVEGQFKAEASANWNEYMREQAYRAERYAAIHRNEADLPIPSAWEVIAADYRKSPVKVTAAVLALIVFTGMGCVWVAVRQGWVS